MIRKAEFQVDRYQTVCRRKQIINRLRQVEVAVSRELFAHTLDRISRLRPGRGARRPVESSGVCASKIGRFSDEGASFRPRDANGDIFQNAQSGGRAGRKGEKSVQA